jgi:hypothetical protein
MATSSAEGKRMKFVVQSVLGLSLILAGPAFAASTAPPAQAALPSAAHDKAVQDLLGAMQVEKHDKRHRIQSWLDRNSSAWRPLRLKAA